MPPWFEEDPERYQAELSDLREAGYKFEVDEDRLANGILKLTVDFKGNGQIHQLTVTYPGEYPYFPFRIIAPTFPAGRHVNPYTYELCIFEDVQNVWDSARDTLASILDDQLPNLLTAHTSNEPVDDIEGHDAHRPGAYIPCAAGTAIFVGDYKIPPEVDRGYLDIALDEATDPDVQLRGTVLRIYNSDHQIISTLDSDPWQDRHKGAKFLRARWIKLDAPPAHAGPDPTQIKPQILEEASTKWPELSNPIFRKGPDIVGLLYPEEGSYHGDMMNGWTFVVRVKKTISRKGKRNEITYGIYAAQTEYLSKEAIEARIPTVSSLATKDVLIVGLGALGSTLSWQLARAGLGTLRCLDTDNVQMGNIPRWLIGVPAVGHFKAAVIAQYLSSNYPFIKVRPYPFRLGFADDAGRAHELFVEAANGVDMIIDASAEWAINHYLSDFSRSQGIPYIWATGTPGAWGGTVGRVLPGSSGGCWQCFQHYLYEGSIPTPPQKIEEGVQPVGCNAPTFTGTGFDLDHISLMATRLATASLCQGVSGGYSDFDWNVGICSLFSPADGSPIAPKWDTFPLDVHSGCPLHD